MKRQWAVSACIAGLLFSVYAETVDTSQTTEAEEASDEGSGEDVIPTECPEVDPVDRTVLLAHESDCTKFYACSSGRKILMQCALMDGLGNRLYFNAKTQMCGWPGSSGCTNKNSTDVPAGGKTTHAPTEGSTSSGEPTHGPTPESTTPGDSGEVIIATECPRVDPVGNAVLLAHESDCTKFYACSSGRKILMQCALIDGLGNHLYFNAKTQMCDWPMNSGCTNKNMTDGGNVTSTEGPTSTEDGARQPSTDGIMLSSTEQPTTPEQELTTEGEIHPSTESPTTSENPTDKPTTEGATRPSSELPTTAEDSTDEPTPDSTTHAGSEEPLTTDSPTPEPSTEGTTQSSTEWPTTPDHEMTSEGITGPPTEGPTSENPTQEPTTEGTTHAGSEEPTTTDSPTPAPSTEGSTEPATELPTTPDHEQTTEGAKTPGTDLPITPDHESTTEGTTHPPTEEPTTDNPTQGSTTEGVTNNSTELPTTPDHESTTEGTTRPPTEEPTTDNPTQEPTTEIATHPSTELPTTIAESTHESTTENITHSPTNEVTTETSTQEPSTETPTTTEESTHESTTEGITNPPTNGATTENPTQEPTTENVTHPSSELPATTAASTPESITEDITNPSTEEPTTTENSTRQPPTEATTHPPTAPPTTTEKSTPEPTEPSTTHTSEPSTPVTPPITDVPDLCPANGSKNGVSYPHECICEKYYICSEAGLVLRQCPNQTHFNPKDKTCDKPENAGCSPASTTEPPSTTIPVPTECPDSDPAVPVQLAHPANCTLYYRCVKGERVLKSCSTGLHFNPHLQLCDWPESAGCTAKEETTLPSPVTSSIPKPSECPADSNRTLIPHETTCSMFYICDKGQKKLASCVPGLEFNPDLRVCESPLGSGCSTSSGSVNSEFMVISDDFDARTSDESDARSHESRDLRHHSSHNHESNDDSRECIGRCPQRNPTEAVQLQHRDCNKFCKCHAGKAHVLKCPSKLYYNPVEQICDYPQNAGCKGHGDRRR